MNENTESKNLVMIIPCYNEERGIGNVIENIPIEKLAREGFSTKVIVIDNNSTDKTAEIAASKGVLVLTETKQGKGNAVLTGFRNIPLRTDYVIMIDGDNTYDIAEAPRLLEPLLNGFGDAVVGSRLHGKISTGSMTTKNRLGNWLFTFLTRIGYQTNITDVCSGFFAWKAEVVKDLALFVQSESFSLEMEMIAKMARLGYDCFSVPISYNERFGSSSLRPFADGFQILKAWLKYLMWTPRGRHSETSSENAVQDN